jgi:FkbM family methyltransferase
MRMSANPYPLWLRRIKWRLDSLLDKCGYKLEKKGESQGHLSFFSRLLIDRMKISKQIVFVQIGANDGFSFDPLYPLIHQCPEQFRGLVVEPLKDKFELLKRTYADTKYVIPVNMAVHNTETEMVLHRVRPDVERKLGVWARGIASFNPEHYKLSHLADSHMMPEKVSCTTFEDLLIAHEISDIELLITDTEGYDFEILRNIDFVKLRPTFIHFEHGLGSGVARWEEYKDLIRYLARYGYNISHETNDATAFLPQALRQAFSSEDGVDPKRLRNSR